LISKQSINDHGRSNENLKEFPPPSNQIIPFHALMLLMREENIEKDKIAGVGTWEWPLSLRVCHHQHHRFPFPQMRSKTNIEALLPSYLRM